LGRKPDFFDCEFVREKIMQIREKSFYRVYFIEIIIGNNKQVEEEIRNVKSFSLKD